MKSPLAAALLVAALSMQIACAGAPTVKKTTTQDHKAAPPTLASLRAEAMNGIRLGATCAAHAGKLGAFGDLATSDRSEADRRVHILLDGLARSPSPFELHDAPPAEPPPLALAFVPQQWSDAERDKVRGFIRCRAYQLARSGSAAAIAHHVAVVYAYGGGERTPVFEFGAPDITPLVKARSRKPYVLLAFAILAARPEVDGVDATLPAARLALIASLSAGLEGALAERHLRHALHVAGRAPLARRFGPLEVGRLAFPLGTSFKNLGPHHHCRQRKDERRLLDRKFLADNYKLGEPLRTAFETKRAQLSKFWVSFKAVYLPKLIKWRRAGGKCTPAILAASH